MYLLITVFLFSQITVTYPFATKETCELAAAQTREFTQGAQAVESSRCEPLSPGSASTSTPTPTLAPTSNMK